MGRRKIALVGDIHFGVKDSDRTFQDSQFAFMEQMVHDCIDNEVEEIFVLGDLFDTRHSVNVLTMNRVVEFFQKHESDPIWWEIILGNHDLYYKNSIDVNSLVALRRIRNLNIVDHVQHFTHGMVEVGEGVVAHDDSLEVPWVTDYEEFRNTTEKFECKRIFGHFDIIGAKMDMFRVSENGFKLEELFEHWQYIYSGHYHHHSETTVGDKRLVYVGSPFQLTRAEVEDKGFYFLNLDTEELEFVKNKHCIEYKKLRYPEMPESPEAFIRGNIIDVEISWEDSKYMSKVTEYLDKIESYGPAYPVNPVYQRRSDMMDSAEKIDVSKITILSLAKKYIDDSPDIKNKSTVYQAFRELHERHVVSQ